MCSSQSAAFVSRHFVFLITNASTRLYFISSSFRRLHMYTYPFCFILSQLLLSRTARFNSSLYMDSTQRKDDRGHSPCFRIIPSSSNVNLASSISISSTSIRASSHTVYSCVQIENLLKKEKDRFVVINNTNRKLTSASCQVFGFAAIIDSNGGPPERIDKFVSCRKCYKTYSFASNSTHFLLDHICNSSDFNDQSNMLASVLSTSVAL